MDSNLVFISVFMPESISITSCNVGSRGGSVLGAALVFSALSVLAVDVLTGADTSMSSAVLPLVLLRSHAPTEDFPLPVVFAADLGGPGLTSMSPHCKRSVAITNTSTTDRNIVPGTTRFTRLSLFSMARFSIKFTNTGVKHPHRARNKCGQQGMVPRYSWSHFVRQLVLPSRGN
ncbi:hypothetical protein BaRGS_00021742 [Batillaria attramentaria]|uniref:Uncharacterized protein n=1 Tax=Batillaria attramentaria TaxID=370345 RepID=A0ABD0KJB0_9CAEN